MPPLPKNNINGLMKKWTKHCKFLEENRLQFLRRATKEDIMIFMKWILDDCPRVRKQSSLHQYFRQFRMLRRKCVGQSLHAKTIEEVNDYINGELTIDYDLDLSMREKMVMNVDDLYITLHYHWTQDTSTFADGQQRLQFALAILICGGTASRPGALVYVERNVKVKRTYLIPDDSECEDENFEKDEDKMDIDDDPTTPEEDAEAIKTLCYEDITLVLLPNPTGLRDLLVMEVNLQYTKGHHKNPKRKIFVFSEISDLVFDAIILMLAIAIRDNAFRSEKIRSVRDIFRLRVKRPRHSLELKWKKSLLKTPIFRQAVPTANGIRTSEPEAAKALRYYTLIYYLQRLGFLVGFPQILSPYDLRRGVGEAVNASASQGILQQVMNHRDAGIFQAYINERVQFDVQAAFLGRPSADAALKATSHRSRYIDPRAPSKLADSELEQLRTHPNIVKYRQLRDSLSAEARRVFGSVKKSIGSEIHHSYAKASAALQALKVNLRKSTLKKSRDQFFDTIDTDEIDKQLDLSLLDLEEKDWEPQKVEHQLPERRRVAELICAKPAQDTEEAALEHRICTVEALVALCRVQESQPQYKRAYDRAWGIPDETAPTLVENDPPVMIYSSKQCPFCLKEFCRPRKMREHAETQHLKFYKADELIPCQNPVCQKERAVFKGHMHFKNHVAIVHKCFLFQKRGA